MIQKKERTMELNINELKNKLKTESKHNFESLRTLVEILRSEEGCPWDREQTHASIRNDLIEETYEVIEGIDKDDRELIREELGDVMFQVMFHSRIEEEQGVFSVDDVINDICAKMIFRHPHVFGDISVEGSAQVLDNWEKIKKDEKSRRTAKESMEAVPKQYPALIRARKVAKKARKDGYEFGSDCEITEKIKNLALSLDCASEEDKERIITDIVWNSVLLAGDEADIEKDISDKADEFIENYNND